MTQDLIDRTYIEISKDRIKLKEKLTKDSLVNSLTWLETPNDNEESRNRFIDRMKKAYKEDIEIIYV
jgi:hypothetical protein